MAAPIHPSSWPAPNRREVTNAPEECGLPYAKAQAVRLGQRACT